MEVKAEPINIIWEARRVEPIGKLNKRIVFTILHRYSGFVIVCKLLRLNDDMAEEYGILASATVHLKPKMIYPTKETAIISAQEYFNKYWLELTKFNF